LGDEDWAKVFNEPELQDLIRTALANNYDVRIAVQHVLEAQAQLRITRAQELPTVSVGSTGIGADLGKSIGNGLPIGTIASGKFNLAAAWDPDFWGLYRRQTEAQRAQLLSQVWAQRAVRMTLVQRVATAYFQLRSYDEQLAIAKETLKDRQESVALTRTLVSGGSNPLSDLRQAEENEYTASAEIPQLEEQIQQQENALRLLLGQNPGPAAHTDPNALAPVPQNLPVGVPSRMLERRPDILEAEEQLVAANANIGVARAQFFPRLSISASGGVAGSDFSQIFSPEGRLICDEIVETGAMDAAIDRVVAGLTSSGVVSAAGNRRAFRITQEPLDMFRSYFAIYAREQAYCHFSPALISNLERYWNAQSRKP